MPFHGSVRFDQFFCQVPELGVQYARYSSPHGSILLLVSVVGDTGLD